MFILLIAALWAGLTVLFLWRLRVILTNLSLLIQPGKGWLRCPTFNVRPLRQLIIWAAELFLLLFFYSVFGVSIIAHLTAAISSFALMIILREKDEPNWLRSVQILPFGEVIA